MPRLFIRTGSGSYSRFSMRQFTGMQYLWFARSRFLSFHAEDQQPQSLVEGVTGVPVAWRYGVRSLTFEGQILEID